MFDHTPSDRVQVRRLGDLMPPGACALCGNGNNDKGYVDLGVYYDYEGQMYYCIEPCMYQVINMLGCLLPDESEYLRRLNIEMASKVASLEAINADITRELNSFYDVLRSAVRSGNLNVPGHTDEESESISTVDITEHSNGRESESAEPVKVSGPDDIAFPELRDRKFNI